MTAAPMIKKANFLAVQGKKNRPTSETVTTFTPKLRRDALLMVYQTERFKTGITDWTI